MWNSFLVLIGLRSSQPLTVAEVLKDFETKVFQLEDIQTTEHERAVDLRIEADKAELESTRAGKAATKLKALLED